VPPLPALYASPAAELRAARCALLVTVPAQRGPPPSCVLPPCAQLDHMLAPGGQLFMVTVLENEPQAVIADMEAKGYAGGWGMTAV
jgi:hypothetical protein